MWPLTSGNQCLNGPEADLFRGAVGMMVDQLVLELNDPDEEACVASVLQGEVDPGIVAPGEVTGLTVPHLYAMWEPEQRLWLLERVTSSVLGSRAAPPAAAIYEATIEAVYVEVGDLIALEISETAPLGPSSWRQTLLDAFVARCPRDSLLEAMHFESTAIDACLPPSIRRHLKQHGYDPDQPLVDPDAAAVDDSPATPARRTPPESGKAARQRDWFAWWAMITGRLLDATFGPRLYPLVEPYRDGDPKQLRQVLQSKGVSPKFTARIPPLRTRAQTQAAIDRLQSIIFRD